jgi:type 1 glutamine amidotransferase
MRASSSTSTAGKLRALLLYGGWEGHRPAQLADFAEHSLLDDFTILSEQYYFLVDPAIKILASAKIDGAERTWLAGVPMPVAWTRKWGTECVFYCALGHTVETLKHGTVTTLLRRAVRWVVRKERLR